MSGESFFQNMYLCHRISIPQTARIKADFLPSEFRLSSADYSFPHGFHSNAGIRVQRI